MGRDAASLWMLFHCHLGGLLSLGWILLLVPSARQQVAQEIGISTSYQLSFLAPYFLLCCSIVGFLTGFSALQSCVSFYISSSQPLLGLQFFFGVSSTLLSPLSYPVLAQSSLIFFFSSSFYKYCLFPLNMLLNILDVPQPPLIVRSIEMKWVSAQCPKQAMGPN